MGHPGVTPLDIVFDHQQDPARFQKRANMAKHRFFVLEKMQRIRHEYAVKHREREILGEISLQGAQVPGVIEIRQVSALQFGQAPAVLVDRVYETTWSNQFTQRQRERA